MQSQAGLHLLGSSNPISLVSGVAGTTGIHFTELHLFILNTLIIWGYFHWWITCHVGALGFDHYYCGGNANNIQCKSNQNCHYKSPPYNILIKIYNNKKLNKFNHKIKT
jgi:hypothetical protein